MIGVSFSAGFLIGPMVGAYFASYARAVVATQHYYFTSPALFAIGVTVIELVLIVTMLPETLPKHMRVCADSPSIQNCRAEATSYGCTTKSDGLCESNSDLQLSTVVECVEHQQ